MRNYIVIILTLAVLLPRPALAGDVRGVVRIDGVEPCTNVVVYIDSIEGRSFDPPTEPAVIDQRRLTFVPHVLAVMAGTKVEFLNSDEVLHNVFTPDACAEHFSLGTWPRGQRKSYEFDETCKAVILCNVHPEMEAYVVVVNTPFFDVTGGDGSFSLRDVPAGTHTVHVWHERLRGLVKTVEVGESGDVTLDLSVTSGRK